MLLAIRVYYVVMVTGHHTLIYDSDIAQYGKIFVTIVEKKKKKTGSSF